MYQLLLLRHAKSSWDDPATSDHDRPLNARGRRAVATMRAALRDLGLIPDMILVSSARRTQETLALLEPWDDTPLVEVMDPLYLAPPARLLTILQNVAESVRSVMVIGHNPGLHELAIALVGPDALDGRTGPAQRLNEGFPTTALAEFAVVGPWQSLHGGDGRLVRFLTPRDLGAQ